MRACVVDWRDLICSFIPFIRVIRVFRVGTSFPLFFYPKAKPIKPPPNSRASRLIANNR